MTDEKYYFCKVCDEEIESRKVKREPLKSSEKLFWGIVIVALIGVAIIPLLWDAFWGVIIALIGIGIFIVIYLLSKKKQYCPECGAKLQVSEEPFEEEEIEPRTAREKVLKKAGKKITKKKELEEKKEEREEKKKKKEKKAKEEKELPEDIFCPFCGSKIKSDVKKCPNCGSKIEDR
jgi:uncharacterized membrane protein